MKNILITGVAGYIGSKLATKLLELGYNVRGVDILKYDQNSLNHLYKFKNFTLIKEDISKQNTINKVVKNIDVIFPLAALVGAPLCDKYPKEAKAINLTTIKKIVNTIKKDQKIIFPTTNSGYGIGEKNKYCTEETPLKPISLYGKTKSEAEKEIAKHSNYISFRLATVFGYSYRMRTDLIVNNFVKNALEKKKLEIFEPNFRRNFIHIDDVVSAFVFGIKNFSKLKNQVYNLGLSTANITKLELAKKIKKQIRSLEIKIIKNSFDPDKRDYFVSNDKIEKRGYRSTVSLEDGIDELIKVFENSNLIIKNNY